jgi:hypothetical protein
VCYTLFAMTNNLTPTERSKFAEKLMDLGNMILAALAFGQVLSVNKDFFVAAIGVMAFMVMYLIAYAILKRR